MTEYFQIPNQRICRDDIIQVLSGGDDPKPSLVNRIHKLTDEEMQRIADRMGDNLVDDHWWDCLRTAHDRVVN